MSAYEGRLPDHDTQMQFIDLPEGTPWTTFAGILIHRATCEECKREGPPEVVMRVFIDGRPHMATISIDLRPVS